MTAGGIVVEAAPRSCGRRVFGRSQDRPSDISGTPPRDRSQETAAMSHQHSILATKGRVGVIRLSRPQALNALNAALMGELAAAIDAFEADANVGCVVMTGSEKALAGGVGIEEMADKSYMDPFQATLQGQ